VDLRIWGRKQRLVGSHTRPRKTAGSRKDGTSSASADFAMLRRGKYYCVGQISRQRVILFFYIRQVAAPTVYNHVICANTSRSRSAHNVTEVNKRLHEKQVVVIFWNIFMTRSSNVIAYLMTSYNIFSTDTFSVEFRSVRNSVSKNSDRTCNFTPHQQKRAWGLSTLPWQDPLLSLRWSE